MHDRWFDRKLRSFVTLEMATLKVRSTLGSSRDQAAGRKSAR